MFVIGVLEESSEELSNSGDELNELIGPFLQVYTYIYMYAHCM